MLFYEKRKFLSYQFNLENRNGVSILKRYEQWKKEKVFFDILSQNAILEEEQERELKKNALSYEKRKFLFYQFHLEKRNTISEPWNRHQKRKAYQTMTKKHTNKTSVLKFSEAAPFFREKTRSITQYSNSIKNAVPYSHTLEERKQPPSKTFYFANKKQISKEDRIWEEALLQSQAFQKQIQQMIQQQIQLHHKKQMEQKQIHDIYQQQQLQEEIYQKIYQKLERTLRYEKRQWGI